MKLEKTNKMLSEAWKVILEMFVIVCCISIMTFAIYSLGLKRDAKCIDGVVMYHSVDMWRAESPIILCKEVLEESL
jgi:hypothetical protein